MATQDGTSELVIIRQFEELGFHAWPAEQIVHENGWLVRLTSYYPSKRGNSINPLDEAHNGHLKQSIEKCEVLLADYGCQPVFRLTPLASPKLAAHLIATGYSTTGGSVVMACDLGENADISVEPDRHPLRIKHCNQEQELDYCRVSAVVHERPEHLIEGLARVLSSIKQQKFPIVGLAGTEAVASMLCVRDAGFTGLFDLCIAKPFRRCGYAKALVLYAMRQALQRGDHTMWLQVEADNVSAISLYEGLKFKPVYDYVYYSKNGCS